MAIVKYRLGAYSPTNYPSDSSCLIRPSRGWVAAQTKAIIALHGRGATSYQFAQAGFGGPMAAQLADIGNYTVLSIDYSKTTPWGDPDAIRALDDAYTYLLSTLGMSGTKVGLIGFSMGGMTALNWLKRNTSKVAALYCHNPATDLRFWHDASGSYTPAYSLTGSTAVQGAFTAEIDTTYSASSTSSGAVTIPASSAGSGVTLTLANAKAFSDSYRYSTLGKAIASSGANTFTYESKTDTTLVGCRSTTAGTISVASGGTITQSYAQVRTLHNPHEDAAGFRSLGVPVKVAQATDDNSVPHGMNDDATNGFVAKVNDASVTLWSPAPTGGHTNSTPNFGAGAVKIQDLVAFFKANH